MHKLSKQQAIPLFFHTVHAGFPSPAEDFIEKTLDLNEYLITHPTATFFVKVKGDSMLQAGIYEDDILIVDRSLTPKDNTIVIAYLNGEFSVKYFRKTQGNMKLVSANPKYPTIHITDAMDFLVWGVVTYVIHKPI